MLILSLLDWEVFGGTLFKDTIWSLWPFHAPAKDLGDTRKSAVDQQKAGKKKNSPSMFEGLLTTSSFHHRKLEEVI